MSEQQSSPEVTAARRGLTRAQRRHVERGCISGDFRMQTVRALKAKGLMHLVIDSPNGQCGFMHLTPLGKAVQAIMLENKGAQNERR